MQRDAGAHKEMRVRTLMKVVNAIREGAYSKFQIQENTGLSWGSCSEIISLLSREDLISVRKTASQHDSRPGRKASGYEFSTMKFLLAGMELKARSIDCSLVNLGGTELNRKEYSLPDKPTNENIFRQISTVYINFLVDSGVKPHALLGLSLSLTGAVDPVKKRLIFSPRYDSLKEMDFSMLQDLLPHIEYFCVDHDINAQSSSVMDKNGWKEANYAFVHCGEGVGMGFYNKEIYTGSRGFAGEIGHVPYHGLKENRICPCGKMNCYETVLSNKGIKDLILEIYGIVPVSMGDLDKSVLTDPILNGIIADAISEMLILISNMLDPGLIVIGGEAIDPFIPEIKHKVVRSLREKAWQGGAEMVRWFHPADINCAYGTIINATPVMIEQYLREKLV